MNQPARPILSVTSLSKDYGGVRAVDGVDLEVFPGEILGLIGPNGAGKTTCFNLLSGFVPPSAGSIVWQGTEISRLSAVRRSRMGLVRTFQTARVFSGLSVRQNLELGAYRSMVPPGRGLKSRLKGRDGGVAAHVTTTLERLGYEHLGELRAGLLSYGQTKRLGVAIATMCEPKLLLLDEPAAGLNAGEVEILSRDISAMNASGIAIILVEHRMELVMNVCTRVIVLDAGKKLAQGSPQSVASDPSVIQAYLGA